MVQRFLWDNFAVILRDVQGGVCTPFAQVIKKGISAPNGSESRWASTSLPYLWALPFSVRYPLDLECLTPVKPLALLSLSAPPATHLGTLQPFLHAAGNTFAYTLLEQRLSEDRHLVCLVTDVAPAPWTVLHRGFQRDLEGTLAFWPGLRNPFSDSYPSNEYSSVCRSSCVQAWLPAASLRSPPGGQRGQFLRKHNRWAKMRPLHHLGSSVLELLSPHPHQLWVLIRLFNIYVWWTWDFTSL